MSFVMEYHLMYRIMWPLGGCICALHEPRRSRLFLHRSLHGLALCMPILPHLGTLPFLTLFLDFHGRSPRIRCRANRALRNMEQGQQVGLHYRGRFWLLRRDHRVASDHRDTELPGDQHCGESSSPSSNYGITVSDRRSRLDQWRRF